MRMDAAHQARPGVLLIRAGNTILRFALGAALASLMILALGSADGQTYPARPIRFVVPFPAGGTPDSIARMLGAMLDQHMGVPVVVDNRSGANGIIGAEIVRKAANDGYTFLLTTVSFIINPSVYRKLPYDVKKDYVPVSRVAQGLGYMLLVNASVPAHTTRELIALANSRQVTYGTPGVGNGQHLITELFNLKAGTHLMHVPYKGLAPALNALLSGEVQAMFTPPMVALPHIKSGKLRPLAFSGPARWPVMPDVPTLAEETVPELTLRSSWQGLFAPAKTPARTVDRIAAEIRKALEAPRLVGVLEAGGFEPIGGTPAEFAKIVDVELRQYAELARLAKITPQ